ncbi:hypothetical protein FGO68_gene6145 [Halteria grandinella]|uniref:Uncharacterized protein n=1 Tax=Halteria grandinella TaxID=5974 RepID=A0A8J8NZD6_HALGN|nr:hypothetical protein FGO68_gene6145 [Halteria grandinella]
MEPLSFDNAKDSNLLPLAPSLQSQHHPTINPPPPLQKIDSPRLIPKENVNPNKPNDQALKQLDIPPVRKSRSRSCSP